MGRGVAAGDVPGVVQTAGAGIAKRLVRLPPV